VVLRMSNMRCFELNMLCAFERFAMGFVVRVRFRVRICARLTDLRDRPIMCALLVD